VVARELAREAALQGSDPWSRRDGWRLFGGATRRFDLDVGGTSQRATLHRGHDGALTLAVGDRHWPFSCSALSADRHDVCLGDQRWTLAVYAEGERVTVFAPHGSLVLQEIDPLAHAGEGAANGRLTAPMPGKVVAFLANVGDAVKAGQPLAVMEAMKMEHTVAAPRDGMVAELMYAVGDQVAEGGELLRLEAAS
jgi:3-methylcrotonyl-CoA carboxylase alpha subunit